MTAATKTQTKTPPKTAAAPERTAAEWQDVVAAFNARDEAAANERAGIETSLGLAAATGDAPGVGRWQQALSDRSDEDAAIRFGLRAAQEHLAEALQREAAEERAADIAELDTILDKAHAAMLKVVDCVNQIPTHANSCRQFLADAKVLHMKLQPPGTDGLAVDRSMRPTWPFELVGALDLGRVGSQFGQSRAAGAADQAEQRLLSYCDRLRVKTEQSTANQKDAK